ncbi:MAG TPA: LLM class flavin-dependent oxidoreductase [Candidatus Lustribacter sp.]|jgi:alkanesulfonate monooxygenase SsuD/methylene tetrahydromethanopterin reductase-like flavin-dependent oxidoreductase (luciferase family)|nr:LLM class flavin-dependent oxidoreductase [Candidatus Lustribacter sp.]
MNRLALGSRNKLKLGIFAANLSSGMFATRVPERWRATWDENQRLAQMADERGLEFFIPLARWKGQGGATNYQDWGFETLTWASALLASTQRIRVFGTVHVLLLHPVVAAKMMSTADHAGRGRFGVNLVVGPSKPQMPMFGFAVPEHDERYVLAQEWLDIVRRLWSDPSEFDFNGKYFQLKELHSSPLPFGGTQPLILNAGASGVGQEYAVRNSDAFFTSVKNSTFDETTGVVTPDLEVVAAIVRSVRARAAEFGREIGVYTNAQIICRPTQKEALDYYRYALEEHADWPAIDNEITVRTDLAPDPSSPAWQERRRRQIRQFPLIGDPDYVARLLITLNELGFDGIGMTMINYLDELPFICDEVVPRLEAAGVRVPAAATAAL